MNVVRKFIREFLLESYRNNFSLETMNSLDSTHERVQYASSKLIKMGTGSSRIVYVMSSKLALKIGIGPFGVIQNRTEFEASKTRSEFLTKCFKHATDFSWITTELVNPVDSIYDVCKYLGIENFALKSVLSLVNSVSTDGIVNQYSTGDSTRFRKFIEFLKSGTIEFRHDLHSASQWGRTVDGRIVILDYGLPKTSR